MDKQQIITFIEEQLEAGTISKHDLVELSEEHTSANVSKENTSERLINVFYAIGAIIVIAGIINLVGQNWLEIGFVGRLLVSLGISVATYIAGLLLRKPGQSIISQVMFVISALLAPLGWYVLLDQSGVTFDAGTQIFISLILSIMYAFAFFVSRRNVLTLIITASVSWLYYALLVKIFSPIPYTDDLLQWATILIGASYILVGWGLKDKKVVQHILYGLGTLAILMGGIFIGGLFDLFYIAVLFAAFYGSVYLKSRAMLIFGALFLVSHIIKLTSKYFVDSIGWPIALILVGFIIIGVGYATLYLNKKYISRT